MYKLFLHKRAAKYYENLEKKITGKINKAIEEMSQNPFEGTQIKKLRGKHQGKYRYAVRDLRIVYRVDTEEKTVFIEAIGPRGDVYK